MCGGAHLLAPDQKSFEQNVKISSMNFSLILICCDTGLAFSIQIISMLISFAKFESLTMPCFDRKVGVDCFKPSFP